MANKALEIQACKVFVCPNISMIDQKGKELELGDHVIKRAKDIAVEYFKKTYHNPIYLSSKNLMPSFIYIASIMEDDCLYKRTQKEISYVFDVGMPTIRKWNKHIIDVLELEIIF